MFMLSLIGLSLVGCAPEASVRVDEPVSDESLACTGELTSGVLGENSGWETHLLDEEGRLVHRTSWEGPNRVVTDYVEEWVYEGALLVEHTTDIRGDGEVDRRITWVFNPDGQLVSSLNYAYGDYANEAGPSGLFGAHYYTYDVDGHLFDDRTDLYGDGVIDSVDRYHWEGDRRVAMDFYEGAETTPTSSSFLDYYLPVPGLDHVETFVTTDDGEVYGTRARTFDDLGFLASQKSLFPVFELDYTDHYVYRPDGQLMWYQNYTDLSSRTTTTFFDEGGRMVEGITDTDDENDGVIEYSFVQTMVWTCP